MGAWLEPLRAHLIQLVIITLCCVSGNRSSHFLLIQLELLSSNSWAHLLRKAIKLMLQHPHEGHYRQFFDELYELYQQAVRWQKDQRLSVGRTQKVERLKARLRELCSRWQESIDTETMPAHEQVFSRGDQQSL